MARQTNNPRAVGWGFLILGSIMFIAFASAMLDPDAGITVNDVYTTDPSEKLSAVLFAAIFPIVGLLILLFVGKGNSGSQSTTDTYNFTKTYEFSKVIRFGKDQLAPEKEEPAVAKVQAPATSQKRMKTASHDGRATIEVRRRSDLPAEEIPAETVLEEAVEEPIAEPVVTKEQSVLEMRLARHAEFKAEGVRQTYSHLNDSAEIIPKVIGWALMAISALMFISSVK
ncbi:hypothetical protein ACKC9G_01405 [Pokkaliibacter sp. CJK22405]|uniref:hypothetical protein n=1 Tax=Pokkaliibacter sp. CJK22405 TaxID=3384615 RepID=UPI003984B93A